ncbi:MAG TPA: tail fiber domain-containing protein [Candidatus Nanoarchaeia archaeon]|nr:tail fiber domain-containing protein [Candidatus Nanoarchaeia archaeon]
MNKQNISNSLKVITLALALSFGIQFAAAQSWTPPTSAPPGNNTYAPINVGASGQVKDGGLTLGLGLSGTPSQFSLLAPYGKVGIGAGVNTVQNPDYNNASVRLDIFGPGNQRVKVQSTDTYAARIDLQNQKSGGGVNAWHVQAWQNGFQLVESGVANRLVAVPGGDIGMGTDAPRGQLHVDRSNAAADIRISAPYDRNAALQLYSNNTNGTNAAHTGWAILRTANSGDLLINRDAVENQGPPATNSRTDFKIFANTGQVIIAPSDGTSGTNTKVNLAVRGRLAISGGNPQTGAVLTSDGTGGAASWVVGSPSDERLKTNITPLKGDILSKVIGLVGVTYNWKDPESSKGTKIGLIAQDVEKIFPEVVSTDPQGIKSVDYEKLVAPLAEAIQSQQEQIEQLRAEIELLKNK